MLTAGGLARITTARGYIDRGDTAAKGEAIGLALSIVGCLRSSLDHEAGGEVAANLDALYEYMEHRLLEANVLSNPAMLDEVHGLLKEIKTGWDGIEHAVASPPPATEKGLQGVVG